MLEELKPINITVGDGWSLRQLGGSRWRKWGESEADHLWVVVGVSGQGKSATVTLDREPGGFNFTIPILQLMTEYLPYFSASGNSLE